MPLATGGGALKALTLPVGIFQIMAFGPFFISELPDWVPRWVGGAIVLVFGVLWALWIFVVLAAIGGGWARRCSDILLSPDGLRVKGGPANGLARRWDQRPPPRCVVKPPSSEHDLASELLLDDRRVALSEDEEELRSFAAVAETVAALGRPHTERPELPRPQVLLCPSCGASLRPPAQAGEPHASCAHCGAAVPLPAELRERLGALGRLESARAGVERLLRTLLRQRGARFTNGLLALALPPLLIGFPLTAILFNEFYVTRHAFRGAHALWLLPFALGFTYGLQLWLQGQVVGRRALRLVALSYRARPPRDGVPWSCRLCGAPLPESGERLVVLCAYCQAENLTGLDLREDAEQMKAQAGSLQKTLIEQLQRRRRWRLLSLLAAGLLALSAVMLLRAFPRTCRDGVRSGDETDVDCGGPCLRCGPARACREPTDCTSKRCVAGVCAAPSCHDGIKNGDESDDDCGGSCGGCPAGSFCQGSRDCKSQRCGLTGMCASP